MRTKVIFTDWLALALKEKGFDYIQRPDKKNPENTVYVFIITNEFMKAYYSIISK